MVSQHCAVSAREARSSRAGTRLIARCCRQARGVHTCRRSARHSLACLSTPTSDAGPGRPAHQPADVDAVNVRVCRGGGTCRTTASLPTQHYLSGAVGDQAGVGRALHEPRRYTVRGRALSRARALGRGGHLLQNCQQNQQGQSACRGEASNLRDARDACSTWRPDVRPVALGARLGTLQLTVAANESPPQPPQHINA